jgi:hypothetical protein
MFEMKGIHYVSTPRPGARRGGGTALACSQKKYTMVKLNVSIPRPLEACFALAKPRTPSGKINKFIVGSFYSPPRSRFNSRLAEFLAVTLGQLRADHPGCRVILGADVNDMNLDTLRALDPSLKQLVTFKTNKNLTKTLDIILTDCPELLQEPTRLPPLQVDQGKPGKDSDHHGVQVLPRTSLAPQGSSRREKITVRPFPESGLARHVGPSRGRSGLAWLVPPAAPTWWRRSRRGSRRWWKGTFPPNWSPWGRRTSPTLLRS